MIKGVGVDIIDIPRIKKLLEKGDSFLEKVFHEKEIDYSLTKHRREIHLAARFASKEAFFKALGTEIITGPTGCNVNDLILILITK